MEVNRNFRRGCASEASLKLCGQPATHAYHHSGQFTKSEPYVFTGTDESPVVRFPQYVFATAEATQMWCFSHTLF